MQQVAVLMELYERYLISSELYLFKKISLLISSGEDDESKAALGAAVWLVSQMSLQVAGHDKKVAQVVHCWWGYH